MKKDTLSLVQIPVEDAPLVQAMQQEAGNCYLYEKIGYHQTGQRSVIKENLTIVNYEKD